MRLSPVAAMIVGRLLRGVFVLWLLSILAFVLVQALPGSPVDVLAGPYSDADTRARISAELGMGDPLVTQYFRWLGQIFQGNLGVSLYNGLPVSSLIADRLVNTLELAIAATLISVLWGVPFGALAALNRGGIFDRIARTGTFLGLATPVFVLGVVLVLAATTWFPAWPTLQYVPFADDPVGNLKSLLLPALALGLPLGSTICRYMRTSMIDTFEQDYMRTALSTGASRTQAMVRHGMRNASAPVVTIAGLQMAGIIGEAVLIENVFAIPGIGQLTVNSLQNQDYAVAQACLLLLGAVYVFMNLVVDLTYPLIDPKVGAKR
ncbi:ABC transporter permease [Nocardioides alcanivorans]|uniref:ABC transporter permease n=1 Tax=Nocardioides alcanivorans TaxID=2897352 RepID=UPI001F223C1A|nr:ABC transporter permease [Nocardioides alcanivorans]